MKMPCMEGLSDVGTIRFKRCIFDRTTAKVMQCLSIVHFVSSEIIVNAVFIYCSLTMGSTQLTALPA